MKAEYFVAFYWLCAGLAAVRMERLHPDFVFKSLLHVAASLVFGGVTIAVRILANLAREPEVLVVNEHQPR